MHYREVTTAAKQRGEEKPVSSQTPQVFPHPLFQGEGSGTPTGKSADGYFFHPEGSPGITRCDLRAHPSSACPCAAWPGAVALGFLYELPWILSPLGPERAVAGSCLALAKQRNLSALPGSLG